MRFVALALLIFATAAAPQASLPDIVRNVMEGSLRTIIGQLTVDELIRDREVFASRVQEVANGDLQGTGLAIDVFTIQSISDSENYIENLGRKAAAEVKRDAEIAEALVPFCVREGIPADTDKGLKIGQYAHVIAKSVQSLADRYDPSAVDPPSVRPPTRLRWERRFRRAPSSLRCRAAAGP